MQNALNQMAVACQSFISWCTTLFASLISNDILLIVLGVSLFTYVFYTLWTLFTNILYIINPAYRRWYNSRHNIDNYYCGRDKK